MSTLCVSCIEGPSDEGGHIALAFQVEGPFPGHHIFRCDECGERWIRHYGSPAVRFAWTRYAKHFAVRRPKADLWRPSLAA